MLKIKIKVELERRLRAQISVPFIDAETGKEVEIYSLVKEIVDLINAERLAREEGVTRGIGYTEILGLFRAELGNQLAVPSSPSPAWVVKQVTRARELGLDERQIKGIVRGARQAYPRGPWELEFLLRAATRLQAERAEESPSLGTVVSGRPEDD